MSTLTRQLTLADSVGIGLGAVVGAGLFFVIGPAMALAQGWILLAILIAAACAMLNGLSSAELAAALPKAGGAYEFASELHGRLLGNIAGYCFIASKVFAAATASIIIGQSLALVIPGLDPTVATVVIVVGLTIANLFGIKKVGRLNLAILAVVFVALAYLCLRCKPAWLASNIPFPPFDANRVFAAAGLMFFAFTGYARLTTLAEEVKDPDQTIPKAVVITLVVATLVYLLVVTSVIGSVGIPELTQTSRPLETAANRVDSRGLQMGIALAATLAMSGVVLSQILGISRVLVAMARRRDMPHPLGSINPAGIPRTAVLATGGTILTAALLMNPVLAATNASILILIYYAIANFCAITLPRDKKKYPTILGIVGLLVCAGLAAATVIGQLRPR